MEARCENKSEVEGSSPAQNFIPHGRGSMVFGAGDTAGVPGVPSWRPVSRKSLIQDPGPTSTILRFPDFSQTLRRGQPQLNLPPFHLVSYITRQHGWHEGLSNKINQKKKKKNQPKIPFTGALLSLQKLHSVLYVISPLILLKAP